MHLIYLPNKHHSLPSLPWTFFKTLTLAYSQANHLQQSLFYNKALNISCNLLNTVPKVKTQWLYMCQLFTLVTLWLTRSQGSHSPAPWENSIWNIASSKKEKNPKLKLGFQLWCVTFTSWLSWKILSQTIMSQEPSAWYNQKLKKKQHYPSIHPFIHLSTLSKYGLKG